MVDMTLYNYVLKGLTMFACVPSEFTFYKRNSDKTIKWWKTAWKEIRGMEKNEDALSTFVTRVPGMQLKSSWMLQTQLHHPGNAE